jgi:hypothetical protein
MSTCSFCFGDGIKSFQKKTYRYRKAVPCGPHELFKPCIYSKHLINRGSVISLFIIKHSLAVAGSTDNYLRILNNSIKLLAMKYTFSG